MLRRLVFSAPGMIFKGLLGTLSVIMGFSTAAAVESNARPNIIIIVADDLGYADIGVHGCKDIRTPNIDSIAKNGVRCFNGYVTCPVCSPTRAALLTGRYQQRFGHEFNPGAAAEASTDFGLPLSEKTLAEQLKKAGYVTGMVGKWHLGCQPAFHPQQRGFDTYFGFLGGGHSYLDAGGDAQNPILRGTNTVGETEYLTDAFTRVALAFLRRHETKPFFLYLTYNAVHTPMQAIEKYSRRFPNIRNHKRRTYAAMLSAMDDSIGAVLKHLRDAKLEEKTVVFFISDNGGAPGANASRNGPLNGAKGQVFEGGIRVPFLVQWKGRLPAGKVYAQSVMAPDIFATAIAAAGAELPSDRKLDAVNLLPYLDGTKTDAPHEALFWRYGNASAVRRGNWKLVKNGNDQAALYDLAADVGEKSDLASQQTNVVNELNALWASWNSELADPLW
jgi:arylsulfatase A-like enzyme